MPLLNNDISQLQQCSNPGEISIYHPGYEDKQPLLTFLGLDDERGGVWREVVETACAIISNNKFDGQLKTEDGQVITDEIIAPGSYWWHLEDLKYAIIPEFRYWQFPDRNDLPAIWRTEERDESQNKWCYLSKQKFGLQRAHIIPQGETEWFGVNRMGHLYAQDKFKASVDDDDNIITMRADLHLGFDQQLWTLFPKDQRVMVHSMSQDTSIYNNVPLKLNVCREFLLARFAWTLYPVALKPWLMMKKDRRLWIQNKAGQLVEEDVSGKNCLFRAYASKPRSTSQKKRKQETLPPDSGSPNQDMDRDSGLGSTDEDDTKLSLSAEWEENNRGRKRLRVER